MRIIARATLRNFWKNPFYSDSKGQLPAWYDFVRKADWASPNQLKADFAKAGILRDGRAVFNIAGNKYRLVVWVNYDYRVVYFALSELTRNTTASMRKPSNFL